MCVQVKTGVCLIELDILDKGHWVWDAGQAAATWSLQLILPNTKNFNQVKTAFWLLSKLQTVHQSNTRHCINAVLHLVILLCRRILPNMLDCHWAESWILQGQAWRRGQMPWHHTCFRTDKCLAIASSTSSTSRQGHQCMHVPLRAFCYALQWRSPYHLFEYCTLFLDEILGT